MPMNATGVASANVLRGTKQPATPPLWGFTTKPGQQHAQSQQQQTPSSTFPSPGSSRIPNLALSNNNYPPLSAAGSSSNQQQQQAQQQAQQQQQQAQFAGGILDMAEFPSFGQKSYSAATSGNGSQYARAGSQSPLPMPSTARPTTAGPPGLTQQQHQMYLQQQQHHQPGSIHSDGMEDKNWLESPLTGSASSAANSFNFANVAASNSGMPNHAFGLFSAPGEPARHMHEEEDDEHNGSHHDYEEQQLLEQEYARRRRQSETWPVPGGPDAIKDDVSAKSVGKESAKKANDDMPYGIGGLMSFMKMDNNNDIQLLAMGSDLTTLGLNLNQDPEPLSLTFGSPWFETSKTKVEPDFRLPACYNVQSAPNQQTKIANFSDETLFYIFYSMPRDIMQEAAAVELTGRNWRYHKELKLWLTKDAGSEPIPQSGLHERGVYTFFDPNSWERIKKEYVLYYQDIA
ncbi:uncharacterized protein V1518DRAFT_421012 [Limtongia smithiae]|uniref:uncharacterized protein n=1 Tax=Limtongia smithiae TaxID=1125753 RepID=UPI0034CF6199